MSEEQASEAVAPILDAVRQAVAEAAPLEIVGAGTKRGIGRPVDATGRLDLTGLTGIDLYEPAELVLRAGAGTPLAEIEAAAAANRQQLSFEPPDFGPLYGGEAGRQTIGGVIACNLAGPRRVQAGAARDHFLGVDAVSGRGEVFKAGGRVVKNVTGYDLCKLLAGSHGTLAVMTRITVKVLPAPEKIRTVMVLGLSDEAAGAAMRAAMGSPYEVSGAAHLPTAIAGESPVDMVRDAGGAVTLIRVEGPGPSVEARAESLHAMLAEFGGTEELHSSRSMALWRHLRDAAVFAAETARPLWRVSLPPSTGAGFAARVAAAGPLRHCFDWAGGLVWLELPDEGDRAKASLVRAAAAEAGGHALLMRASPDLRAEAPAFHPPSLGRAALSARIKEAFDPCGILNPGRMYPKG
jgi:glycolate oxidase FAD binding subunit